MTNVNQVCNILIKDNKGLFRKLFSVEGDTSNDMSVYFYEWHGDNGNERKSHYSYHARIGPDGLVQTHISDIKDVSQRRQKPLEQRDRVICAYHYNDNQVDRFLLETLEPQDLLVTIKPEYFKWCEYVFYPTDKGLIEHARQKNLIVLHKYQIPVKNVKQLNFAVLIPEEILVRIQSGKSLS